MRNRRYLIEAAILSLLSLLVVAPWGCSSAPLAPIPATAARTLTLPNGLIVLPGTILGGNDPAEAGTFDLSPRPYTLDSSAAGSKMEEYGPFVEDITSTGGVIVMTIDEDSSFFVVPDEGLDKTTQISVSVMRDLNAADARITEFAFQPEGLRFEKPASLAYRTDEKEGERVILYWWDAPKAIWVASAEAIVVNGYCTFPIEHFSKYRVKERISLGGQRGSN